METTQIPRKPSFWRSIRKSMLGLTKREAKKMAYTRRRFKQRNKHGRIGG